MNLKKTFKIKIYTYEQSSETNIKIHIFLNIKSVLKTNQIITHFCQPSLKCTSNYVVSSIM